VKIELAEIASGVDDHPHARDRVSVPPRRHAVELGLRAAVEEVAVIEHRIDHRR
jgi:hypothetical protein